ncbi:MAG: chlorophyllide reductase subunit Y, partial [Pseudomonadota bacterium]
MDREVTYDTAHEADVIEGEERSETVSNAPASAPVDGMGCHASATQMEAAARASGNAEVLDQFAKDYPQGPHDKPQSMCPAF